ncbi:MAG: hypothetical protein ABJ263_08175 [Tateyamaria sp.]|uniref:hypothetical protein n=1 Tax=Tateyamaria sp. TaxID=1929288 RepID=UPI00327DDE3C
MQTEFDHIVVGGGSAGCAVAARLAEQPGALAGMPPARLRHPRRPRATFGANTNGASMMNGWQIGGPMAAATHERTAT